MCIGWQFLVLNETLFLPKYRQSNLEIREVCLSWVLASINFSVFLWRIQSFSCEVSIFTTDIKKCICKAFNGSLRCHQYVHFPWTCTCYCFWGNVWILSQLQTCGAVPAAVFRRHVWPVCKLWAFCAGDIWISEPIMPLACKRNSIQQSSVHKYFP